MRPLETKALDHRLAARASVQEGLLRAPDLTALGATRSAVRHRLGTGRLHELHPGIFALGHLALTRRAEFLAAQWWCGDDAAVTYESAAAFKGWIMEDPDNLPPIHVSTTRHRRSRPGVVVHRTRHLGRKDVLPHGLLRVSDDARTLVDLADHLTYDELRAVADALPVLPVDRIAATAARLPGRRGAPRVQELITSVDARTRYAMERRSVAYFARWGVPEPQRNVKVHGLRVDCWFPGALFVVELDSRAHHTRQAEFERDRQRDRRLRRHHISTMRLVWGDLDPDDPLAAQDVLRELGLEHQWSLGDH